MWMIPVHQQARRETHNRSSKLYLYFFFKARKREKKSHNTLIHIYQISNFFSFLFSSFFPACVCVMCGIAYHFFICCSMFFLRFLVTQKQSMHVWVVNMVKWVCTLSTCMVTVLRKKNYSWGPLLTLKHQKKKCDVHSIFVSFLWAYITLLNI